MFLLLMIGMPMKPFRFLGKAAVKMLIGALFLFFLNTFGTAVGLHVPINLATAAISGFLGIPGVIALAAIAHYIVP